MDEPFAALDALTRRELQEELLQLWEDVRFTVLFVTHSIEEAIIVGSRILVLSPHPGRVKAELNAHQFDHHHQGGPEFMALNEKIRDMLFAERIEADAVRAEASNG
jgi:NitT/TauT family transport system ATP-binding protein